MAISGLHIIGESINDSVPSTKAYYDADDFDAIRELARFQAEHGAVYLDVNVGSRSTAEMEKAIRAVEIGATLPLSIDSPDPELAAAGLRATSTDRPKPILNSISPLRTEMFALLKIRLFRPILLISEDKKSDGTPAACRTIEETMAAAESLYEMARSAGLSNDDMIFDPGIAPIASDTDGNLGRVLGTLERIAADPKFRGVHASVGLSNFTVMLPPKKKDGTPVKGPLESAFLTRAVPLGLDFVIGSVRRNYQRLDADHPAILCLDAALLTPGIESLLTVKKFYR